MASVTTTTSASRPSDSSSQPAPSSNVFAGLDESSIPRPRPKPAMQLPTVCVSSLADSLQQQQHQQNEQLANTLNLLAAAAAVTTITSTSTHGTQTNALESPLVSPVFVDTSTNNNNLENPHAFRLASGGATSALHADRWFGYRHERNSSSSSDSGLAFPFSPPAHTLGLSSPNLPLSISPISPPGLSPLQISTDSAFSTPNSTTRPRAHTHFTFDNLPTVSLPKKEEPTHPIASTAAAFDPQFNNFSTTSALAELLLRRVSADRQQNFQAELAAAISQQQQQQDANSSNSSLLLQPGGKTAVFRSESLPAVRDPQQQQQQAQQQQQSEVEKLLHSFNLIQQQQQQKQNSLSAFSPPAHVPIGRTASLNAANIASSTNSGSSSNPPPPPVFVVPQAPAAQSQQQQSQQPLLLQRPPLKATLSSPLNNATPNDQKSEATSALRRKESTKRKLLKSSGSKDVEEPKSKNVATDTATAQAADPNAEDPDQQFLCRFCNKDFRRPDILARHLRRHTGEKPFLCDCCGRTFSRSDHLRTHRRTHTNEKPYRCNFCHYAARRRDVLTRHVSTRHQQKAGPSILPQSRRGRRALSAVTQQPNHQLQAPGQQQQPLPKSPLAGPSQNNAQVAGEKTREKEEVREPKQPPEEDDGLQKRKPSASDEEEEDSNIFIDVTNVDSDEEEGAEKDLQGGEIPIGDDERSKKSGEDENREQAIASKTPHASNEAEEPQKREDAKLAVASGKAIVPSEHQA